MNLKKIVVTAALGLAIVFGAAGCEKSGTVDSPVPYADTTSTPPAPTAEGTVDPSNVPTDSTVIDPKYLDHLTVKKCVLGADSNSDHPKVHIELTAKNKVKGDAYYLATFGIYDNAGTQIDSFDVNITGSIALHYGDVKSYEQEVLVNEVLPKQFTCRLGSVDRVPTE